MPIYLTPYDFASKKPTGASQPLPFDELDAAQSIMGREPDIKDGKTWIWHVGGGQSVCLSRVCFCAKLPETIQEDNKT